MLIHMQQFARGLRQLAETLRLVGQASREPERRPEEPRQAEA